MRALRSAPRSLWRRTRLFMRHRCTARLPQNKSARAELETLNRGGNIFLSASASSSGAIVASAHCLCTGRLALLALVRVREEREPDVGEPEDPLALVGGRRKKDSEEMRLARDCITPADSESALRCNSRLFLPQRLYTDPDTRIVVRNGGHIFIRPIQDVLKTEPGKKDRRWRKILAHGSLMTAKLRAFQESDCAMLIVSEGFSLHSPNSPKPIKYRSLSDLFNAIPLYDCPFTPRLDFATSTLQLARVDIEKWLREREISSEESPAFLKTVADAYEKSGGTAGEYSLAYPSGSPSFSTSTRCCKPDAVFAAKEHVLTLFRIFFTHGLPEFKAWEASHLSALENYHTPHRRRRRRRESQNSKARTWAGNPPSDPRIRRVQNIGHEPHDLPYAQVAEAFQLKPSGIEKWFFDIIRAGILSGKHSQMS
ncbi:hypothetical protein FB451DRAFT_1392182 [Mycena latifolia]|nr:hypothetical protein FB451DRAFT_1392182 [Mycena latifolia]